MIAGDFSLGEYTDARTVRRLFVAYFLTRAKLRALTTDAASRSSADYEMGIEAAAHYCHKDGVRCGRQMERDRIAAALRAAAKERHDFAYLEAANRIERGEL